MQELTLRKSDVIIWVGKQILAGRKSETKAECDDDLRINIEKTTNELENCRQINK